MGCESQPMPKPMVGDRPIIGVIHIIGAEIYKDAGDSWSWKCKIIDRTCKTKFKLEMGGSYRTLRCLSQFFGQLEWSVQKNGEAEF